tara:strand:- start:158 stop:616 length:459 start_codon:yes stop_codon:yes gene_type:complete
MFITRPLSTFVHEFGHLIPMYFFSSEPITFQIGEGKSYPFKIGSRVELRLSWKGLSTCSVYFDDEKLSKRDQLFVLFGGPFLSFFIISILFFFLQRFSLMVWFEVTAIGFLCSNLLVFLTSIIPMHLKPTSDFPDGPPSDGLQILTLLKSKS